MEKSIVLVDGNSLMFRAYYATAMFNLMQTSTGIYTNAVYGFVNMITKIMSSFNPNYMLVAFDKGKQTFRHKALETYKGTRKHMPEELAMQLPLVREYLDVVGIKRLELDDYEADDIVGSMAKLAASKDFKVTCLSGDKDLLQLASNKVTVMLTKKGITELEEYNSETFRPLMGFDPWQMVDFKSIIGDKSDNLEGVKGVGEKTAVSLLNKYNSLEGIYEHIDELTPAVRNNFIASRDVCAQTRFLATIYQDINFDFDIEDCIIKNTNFDKLRSFYEKLEFNSFIKKMNYDKKDVDETTNDKVLSITINKYLNDVEKLENELKNASICYFDVELAGDNYHKSNILGFTFIVENNAYFIDKGIFLNTNLKEYLESPFLELKCIDAKKCYVALKYLGIELNNITYDFEIACYVLNPNYIKSDLKSILENFTSNNLPYLEEVYGKKSTYQIPEFEVYANYAMDKLCYAKNIEDELIGKLKSIDAFDLYFNTELPLALVLGDIEFNGYKIDKARLDEIGMIFQDKMKEAEKAIFDLIGREINVASPKQIGTLLFEELQIAKGKKNKTGYQTGVEVLEKLVDRHPVVPLILEYRKYAKLYSTYYVGLMDEIAADGKVHTTFKQTLTATGRLSSTEPNIQNIPTRTEEGKVVRSAFVPSFDDGLLISADYSQIELRVLAEMSGCETMINDFNHGLDLHTSTASKINNVEYSQVTKEMRRMAKAVNFGIVYGMSDWGLSERINITPIDAAIFIEKYFDIYPEIKAYLDKVVENAKKDGYTKTLFGRRRYIPELASPNYALRTFGERTSQNAPIQGTAADIIKMAMVNVAKRMKQNNLQSLIVAQVHDELIIDACSSEIEQIKQILKQEMENVVKLKVQLTVDVETGFNWDMK